MDFECMDNLTTATNELLELMCLKKDDECEKCIEKYIQTVKIPSVDGFPEDAEWFNVSSRLTLNQLKGKIVVLDFFTYCCINCMHILPDLKDLESKYSIEDGILVIGVHSAKFDNEKNSENVMSAIQRYNISHPVINDSNAEIWNKLNICCWPTFLILGPHLNPLFVLMGEGHKENLFLILRQTLNYYKKRKEIKNHSLPISPVSHLLSKSEPLLFPGKITYFKSSNKNVDDMIAVSDTGNNRIIIMSLDGLVSHVIGGKGNGFKDGPFSEVKFNSPQGLVFFNENIIFVADTENHAIRKIDLSKSKVTTVAGTGVQGIDRVGGKLGTEQEISSPWDVCVYSTPDMDMTFHGLGEPMNNKNVLLIAMAGTHQIWALFLDDLIWWKFKRYSAGTCIAIAGSGKEENRNNIYPHLAAFAQPSGLALAQDAKELYIADSESSTVRRLCLVDGKVTCVVGGDRNPNNLFAFGDRDGQQFDVKLQHPLGVAWSENGNIYVADSYNHKIKEINAFSNAAITLCGSGKSGDAGELNEPGGICFGKKARIMYIADTNNHAIKIFDVIKKQPPIKMMLSFPTTSRTESKGFIIEESYDINNTEGILMLEIISHLKPNFKLTENAPHKFKATCPNGWSINPMSGNFDPCIKFRIETPSYKSGTKNKFSVGFSLISCEEGKCVPIVFTININVNFSEKVKKPVNKIIKLSVSLSQIEKA